MDQSDMASRAHWWRVRVSPARQAAGLLLLVLVSIFFYWMLAKGLRFFVVEAGSMEPTLFDGDRLVAIRQQEYHRGEIVIVRDPIDRRGYLVKRVIGLPGDTVEVRAGSVFLNGQYLSEPYRPEPINYSMAPYTVPPHSVFVLGDNSNLSVDSHNWAAARIDSDAIVPEALLGESVVARAVYQYYPFGRMGPVLPYPLYDLEDLPPVRTANAPPVQ